MNRPRSLKFSKSLLAILTVTHLSVMGGLGAGFVLLPERSVSVRVNIGERVSDWCSRLEKRNVTDCEAVRGIAARRDFPELNFVPAPRDDANRFEGLFRPGAYKVGLAGHITFLGRREAAAEKIIEHLLRRVASRYAGLDEYRGLSPRHQAILASIVEKEAASNQDYRRVAGVFHHRLRWGGRLGSCPTVEYALGYHRPFLKTLDLQIESPYNVYYYRGLPPTPIAFFSDDALAAVRDPIIGRIYFFVFDWTTKQLHFARYYEDHRANARRVRANYVRLHGRDALFRKHVGGFYGLVKSL